jgi:hypothetical protein
MDVHVTRETLADDAGEWLLQWQREGWTPVTSPVQVGVTALGETVLRFTLSIAPGEQRGARSAPRESTLPAWVPTSLAGAAAVPGPRGSVDRWPYDADVPSLQA